MRTEIPRKNDPHFSTDLPTYEPPLAFVKYPCILLLGGWPMLFAIVSRGKKLGIRLFPHRFNDDRYHVHLGKEGPYIPVTDYRDIPSYLANGYSLQMSDAAQSHPPSLIKPESVHGWSTDPKDLFFPTL
jgi:hypothetical protein